MRHRDRARSLKVSAPPSRLVFTRVGGAVVSSTAKSRSRSVHGRTDLSEALTRTRRFFTRAEMSPDLRAVSARGGVLVVHLLPHPVRYPYIRGVLLEAFRAAKARIGDPVPAWRVVSDPCTACRYKAARGNGGPGTGELGRGERAPHCDDRESPARPRRRPALAASPGEAAPARPPPTRPTSSSPPSPVPTSPTLRRRARPSQGLRAGFEGHKDLMSPPPLWR